jgi:hypothetical protein
MAAEPVSRTRTHVAVAVVTTAAIVAVMAVGGPTLSTIAGGAAIVVAIASPPAGLAMLILMAPLADPFIGFELVLGGAILFGSLPAVLQDRHSVRIDPFWLVFGAFGVFALIQMLGAPSDPSGEQLKFAIAQFMGLAAGGAMLLAAQYLLKTRDWGPFADVAVLAGVAAAALALAAAATGGALQASVPALYGIGEEQDRAVGPFNNPNYFGLFEGLTFVVAIHRLSIGSLRRRLLTAAAAMVILAGVALSFSRGAILSTAVGVIALAFARSRRAGLATLLACGVAAAVLYGPFSDARFSATNPNQTASQRLAVLEVSDAGRLSGGAVAFELFALDPLFGVGFGQYHFVSPRYVGPDSATYSHDWYLNVLGEQGLLGIVLVAAGGVLMAVRLLRADRPRRALAVAVLGAYAVGCVFTESPTYLPTTGVAWLVAGAALASIGARSSPDVTASPRTGVA